MRDLSRYLGESTKESDLVFEPQTASYRSKHLDGARVVSVLHTGNGHLYSTYAHPRIHQDIHHAMRAAKNEKEMSSIWHQAKEDDFQPKLHFEYNLLATGTHLHVIDNKSGNIVATGEVSRRPTPYMINRKWAAGQGHTSKGGYDHHLDHNISHYFENNLFRLAYHLPLDGVL